MWNYSFMLPTLMVLVTLVAFYFARPRLPIRMNRTFLRLIIVEMLTVISDLVSSLADENYQSYSPGALYLANTLFFVLFVARIFSFYRFTTDILNINSKNALTLALPGRLMFFVTEAVCLSSFFTGAVFSIQETGYQRGPFYNIIYVCFFFYIFLSLALVIVCRKRLHFYSLISAIAYNLVLFTGNIVRILMPKYLVMNTFCLVAITIIYLAFMNPDLYKSDRGPAFNMRGLTTLLNELTLRKDYHILGFVIQNYMQERSILGGMQMDEGIRQISRYLVKTYPHYQSFYLRNGRFALVGTDRTKWDDVRQAIYDRFQQPWRSANSELDLNVAFAFISSESHLGSVDRIVNNLSIALEIEGRTDRAVDGSDAIDPLRIQQIDQQVDIMRSLEQALEHNQVEVFLQPVYDSHTRTMAAAEALARIRDAEGKIIPPVVFIPIAEKSGYIDRLGEQVLEKTCAFIRDHDMEAMGLQWINVNLSPIQCMQRELPEHFAAILKKYDVPADRIHLELTEQSMVDYALLKAQVAALQALGFCFVLDDYGSGYSNLTRVRRYPFINIKLDMEIVWDYFRERDNLLPTIVQGFRQMDLSITAEGIESEEMADVLTEIGSDYLQGYLFSKPLPMY